MSSLVMGGLMIGLVGGLVGDGRASVVGAGGIGVSWALVRMREGLGVVARLDGFIEDGRILACFVDWPLGVVRGCLA